MCPFAGEPGEPQRRDAWHPSDDDCCCIGRHTGGGRQTARTTTCLLLFASVAISKFFAGARVYSCRHASVHPVIMDQHGSIFFVGMGDAMYFPSRALWTISPCAPRPNVCVFEASRILSLGTSGMAPRDILRDRPDRVPKHERTIIPDTERSRRGSGLLSNKVLASFPLQNAATRPRTSGRLLCAMGGIFAQRECFSLIFDRRNSTTAFLIPQV